MTDTESEHEEGAPCLDKDRDEVPTFLDTETDSEGPSASQSLPVPSAEGNAPTQATAGQQQRSIKRLRRADGWQVRARSLVQRGRGLTPDLHLSGQSQTSQEGTRGADHPIPASDLLCMMSWHSMRETMMPTL